MSSQRHLVTGANGQDGGYLVARLLEAGHEVHAMCHSRDGRERLAVEQPRVVGHVADLADATAIGRLIADIAPSRIYNLAGNTSVARSWEYPAETADVLGLGPVRILEAAWRQGLVGSPVRMLQASSAEIFGDASEVPQTEQTPRKPVTPYGAAKSFAHEMASIYRARGMHVSNAILYNHESPRRPATFVARKIAIGVARISLGLQDELVLGNIDVHRDWGYAPDYVEAMIRIVEQPEGGDYIVATGESHSVREFVAEAFRHVGIEDWERYVRTDPAFYRPADPQELVGDPRRLRDIGWQPTVGFTSLVHTMVGAELVALGSAV
ncbi:GDP-mannose 4,6-dehydratase [Protaetiibacter mangrovi]|uniref:GDP-mannose 4,6-dehydratase n=1 Tax=Protaetiibacter mangrovi TaxID=2970926 RepID=A0ABT1ZFI4_9MICO|nr:GDP-mannose 4,6-dehydratase [Protaetiibacter mangrovi]MCS0499461.1 GDP-mannose 4,6-dehydratase [Protaetiibacter mangrovi]